METPEQTGEGKCFYCGTEEAHTCKQAEQSRAQWDYLLEALGSYELERRIKKLKNYKLYDRKYPYDVATKAMSIEYAYDLSTNEPDPLAKLIDQEAFDERMEQLTDTQKLHAQLYMEGYKPRDIAAFEGRETSNAVRWQRHNMKERLS